MGNSNDIMPESVTAANTARLKRLSASELVGLIIDGLKGNWLDEISMQTYGQATSGGLLVGCAATAALSQWRGARFSPSGILTGKGRAKELDVESMTLSILEDALDSLRLGLPTWDASALVYYGFAARFLEPEVVLPHLGSKNYTELLPAYEAYRQYLIEKGH